MKKILIVEDEEALGKILQEELHDHAFDAMLIAEGGQAVFDAVSRVHPDLILLDIILPKMDGLTMLAKLKSDDAFKSIPVIIMSNMEQDEKVQKALTLGAVDYFVKSQHPMNEIIEKIRKYVITG